MAIYLTVDGGTTNTRIYLVCDNEICDIARLSVGARDGRESVAKALRAAIADLLSNNKISSSQVSRIIASGMISSEYGLVSLPHIELPAGINELKSNAYGIILEDICDIPWSFIRGVRSKGVSVSGADVMRGEETELMGIISKSYGEALYILPGSHSKHVSVDAEGRIVSFKTLMSGELFSAVISGTILKDAVDLLHSEIEEEHLIDGYEYCKAHGINEALFKVRIMKNIFGESREHCYNFLLGAVLEGEIRNAVGAPQIKIVIGGQKQMKMAIDILLSHCSKKEITVLDDKTVDGSVALGALRIYEAQ